MATRINQRILYRAVLEIVMEIPGISIRNLLDKVITSLHQSETVDLHGVDLSEAVLAALDNMFKTSKNWITCSIDTIPIIDEAQFRDVIWGRDHHARLSITQRGMEYLRSGRNRQAVTRSTREVDEESTAEAGVFEFQDMENTIQAMPAQKRARDIADERRTIARAINNRRGQAKFRQDLIEAYGQCLVTGCTYEPILEAAHIYPYSEGGNFSIENGLLLRADIHTLFDLGLIAICTLDDAYRIITSEFLDDTEYFEYSKQPLLIPEDSWYRPDKSALEEHIARSGLEYLCY